MSLPDGLMVDGRKFFYKLINKGDPRGPVLELWASKKRKSDCYLLRELGSAKELYLLLKDLEERMFTFNIKINKK